MKHYKAIAAMSENRVIGCGGKIPWHLPEDFRFFRKTTDGHIMVMGRRTFQSIGRALPGRHTIVLSRRFKRPSEVLNQLELFKIGTFEVVSAIQKIDYENDPRDIFICGGAQIYEQTLPFCSDLYLTVVKRAVEGDAFFPPFEDSFRLEKVVLDCPEFEIRHYVNKRLG